MGWAHGIPEINLSPCSFTTKETITALFLIILGVYVLFSLSFRCCHLLSGPGCKLKSSRGQAVTSLKRECWGCGTPELPSPSSLIKYLSSRYFKNIPLAKQHTSAACIWRLIAGGGLHFGPGHELFQESPQAFLPALPPVTHHPCGQQWISKAQIWWWPISAKNLGRLPIAHLRRASSAWSLALCSLACSLITLPPFFTPPPNLRSHLGRDYICFLQHSSLKAFVIELFSWPGMTLPVKLSLNHQAVTWSVPSLRSHSTLYISALIPEHPAVECCLLH